MYKYKKYLKKSKKISQVGLGPNVIERERERERKEGEEKQSFSSDFTGFYWSELGRPRVKVALCMGTGITRFHQGSGFHGNREKAVSWEITQIEVGFLSYSV